MNVRENAVWRVVHDESAATMQITFRGPEEIAEERNRFRMIELFQSAVGRDLAGVLVCVHITFIAWGTHPARMMLGALGGVMSVSWLQDDGTFKVMWSRPEARAEWQPGMIVVPPESN